MNTVVPSTLAQQPKLQVVHSDYQYMNEEAVEKELKCSICTQPFQEPVTTRSCHHTFCKNCITTWLVNQHQQSCPECRCRVFQNDLEKVNTLNFLSMLDSIPVLCTHCKMANIPRGNMSSHLKKCPQFIVTCLAADIECPWTGPREKMTQHLQWCTFQKLRPIIQSLRNDTKSQALQQQNICNELRTEINTLDAQLQEHKRFIQIFINGGYPMSDQCIAMPHEECTVLKHIRDARGRSNNQRLLITRERSSQVVCLVCKRDICLNTLSLHHCNGGCICKTCINKYCPSSAAEKSINCRYHKNRYKAVQQKPQECYRISTSRQSLPSI